MKDRNPKAILLQDYHAPDYRIERVALCFKLYAEKTVVESKIDLTASDLEAVTRPPLVLHGEQLSLQHLLRQSNQNDYYYQSYQRRISQY